MLEDYKKLRHYNIAELAKPEGESKETEVKEDPPADGEECESRAEEDEEPMASDEVKEDMDLNKPPTDIAT